MSNPPLIKALKPVKSYAPPSVATTNVAPVSSKVILYGAVPPLIVPVMFPSASPLQRIASPAIVTTNGKGSAIAAGPAIAKHPAVSPLLSVTVTL